MPKQNTSIAIAQNLTVKTTFDRTFVTGPLKGLTLSMSNTGSVRKALKYWAREGMQVRDADGNLAVNSNVCFEVSRKVRRVLPRAVGSLIDLRIRPAA